MATNISWRRTVERTYGEPMGSSITAGACAIEKLARNSQGQRDLHDA